MIPSNKQVLVGKELEYIKDAYDSLKIAGGGKYTRNCERFIEERFKAKKAFLTTSCTHALEMSAFLIDIRPGDEVIMPSFTFVSTANAFVIRGARPVFVDIREDTLNIDEKLIREKITSRTKAIVPVHYAGVGAEMDVIMEIAKEKNLYVIEDAAQGIGAKYKDKFLGTIGHFGTYSFHETKNFTMGEGGALLINDKKFVERAEIIREKGTDRSKFFRGEVDKYTWVDIGSSYIPSEINAAILWAQFENIDHIQNRRKSAWLYYYEELKDLENRGVLRLPIIPENVETNYHIFYVLFPTEKLREKIRNYLKSNKVNAIFHYIPLHLSTYYRKNYGEVSLPVTESIASRILRLPLYNTITESELNYIVTMIKKFFR
ncbi:dTDP-4-amino-4,6-dideoxygalactose transaminase [Thermosipho ferrireducens]|uniref:dTDP-4-amino-4,6-dideoxygalactose transaminase n=1 Tax=Thermosipho ferrireducens TaxID=2571116 RepID=A0ABX7S7S3_9BACT|nr:dTDP-4-amino-4,6-dideoxygalactose transaminase [Thermosipho ferrireducens]QTA38634.1 dTDP-4-amino-4,6-dideoxygalactose transaminase [Thermosipho ferrireducens]